MPDTTLNERSTAVTEEHQISAPLLGALDLGSNSFHLLVATESHDRIQIIDKYKEMVRLADGLDDNNALDEPTIARAMDCLHRLGQRLRPLAPENVRVVGTNTLRRARNSAQFIQQAEAALGHKIETVSGREEARLIFIGVCHDLGSNDTNRLVVDIGGGSTEIITGRNNTPEYLESLHMGCVSMSKKHFDQGKIDRVRMDAAIQDALVELEPVVGEFRLTGWESAVGASGTINAIAAVVKQAYGHDQITSIGLNQLTDDLIKATSTDKIKLPGLADERKPVICGGVAVLQGVFQALSIDSMTAAQSALREGLIYDLLGRQHHHDARDQTVRSLIQRYRIDQNQAQRVRETALLLLGQAAADWALEDPHFEHILGWAADLHELGMDISHSGFHKHGAYLLQNMDLPGFSRRDQAQVATLVRVHRRKLNEGLFEGVDQIMIQLATLLRLGVVLHRNRTPEALPKIKLAVDKKTITLTVPSDWLADHPLTRVDLQNEANYLKSLSFTLNVVPS